MASAKAMDFSFKANAVHNVTDNVNLTNTNPIADTYQTLSGFLQLKNEDFKFRLKGKLDKYKKQDENSNYSTELSGSYKHTKSSEYILSIFNQVYNGIPAVTTDTTSDNKGARASATFSNDFSKETNGYISFNATIKNYTKNAGRKDKIYGAYTGLEHNFTPQLMINLEINLSKNASNDSYYENISYGPSFLVS